MGGWGARCCEPVSEQATAVPSAGSRWLATRSSAASCRTCCPGASSASAIAACWPTERVQEDSAGSGAANLEPSCAEPARSKGCTGLHSPGGAHRCAALPVVPARAAAGAGAFGRTGYAGAHVPGSRTGAGAVVSSRSQWGRRPAWRRQAQCTMPWGTSGNDAMTQIRAVQRDEITLGTKYLLQLFKLLPNLRCIVLVGGAARRAHVPVGSDKRSDTQLSPAFSTCHEPTTCGVNRERRGL